MYEVEPTATIIVLWWRWSHTLMLQHEIGTVWSSHAFLWRSTQN